MPWKPGVALGSVLMLAAPLTYVLVSFYYGPRSSLLASAACLSLSFVGMAVSAASARAGPPAPPPGLPIPQSRLEEPAPRPAEGAKPRTVTCPACGASSSAAARACERCGRRLLQNGAQLRPARPGASRAPSLPPPRPPPSPMFPAAVAPAGLGTEKRFLPVRYPFKATIRLRVDGAPDLAGKWCEVEADDEEDWTADREFVESRFREENPEITLDGDRLDLGDVQAWARLRRRFYFEPR